MTLLTEDSFTTAEAAILQRYFTNINLPVFGLKNLPEVVKGALFARYSRSAKSLRRLFLDEFYLDRDQFADNVAKHANEGSVARAEQLFDRVFCDYGDDSVAQLGGAHLACEGISNVLTKVLERGRVAAYLEKSTRYVLFDKKVAEKYRYSTPGEIATSALKSEYEGTMNALFEAYSSVTARLLSWLEARFPRVDGDSVGVWRASLRAKACDIARGLLPASTTSNVGVYATGQSYEAMLLRMSAHPLDEVKQCASMMLTELRELVPAFVRRVDQPQRGIAWSKYLSDVNRTLHDCANRFVAPRTASRPEVVLVDWDPEGEDKVLAAALYEHSEIPDDQLLDLVRQASDVEKDALFREIVGHRENRRHKPGRGFERTFYRFDVVCDYAAFRDLQRHRMLTVQWQPLSTAHGYVTPTEIAEIGADKLWHSSMKRAARCSALVAETAGSLAAQYVVPFAYRIRFSLQMNAREAIHLIELRTQRQGHPEYRRVCQTMHSLIREQAGHRRIADSMVFVDYANYDLERLAAERQSEAKRADALA